MSIHFYVYVRSLATTSNKADRSEANTPRMHAVLIIAGLGQALGRARSAAIGSKHAKLSQLIMRRALSIARRLQAVRATVGDAAQVCSGSGRSFAAESSGEGLAPIHLEDELYCRQRQQLVLGNRIPDLSPDVWLAPNAVIIGDVDLFDRVHFIY